MAVGRKVFNLQGRANLLLLITCLSLWFCFVSYANANELVNLPLHDEAYAFAKRLTAKNLIRNRLDTTRPLTRRAVAEALIEISERYQAGQIALTEVESNHLRHFQYLFGDEIESLKPGFLEQAESKHTFTVKGEEYKVDFDLKAKQETAFVKPLVKESVKESQNTSITSTEVITFGKLGSNVGISSTLHSRVLLGSDTYNPYQAENVWNMEPAFTAAIVSMEGYVVLDWPWASVQWGVDEAWWGPGWHGALMLSDNSPPKGSLRLSGSYGTVKFTYFTAILGGGWFMEYHPKYMAAHRLEFLPYRGINIGLSEIIVFADRYEPRYLNPFISYQIMQTEDLKNNGLLGADFDITLVPSVEFYGELMVDDFQINEGMDAFRVWNSKYGLLVGGYWIDPFGLEDIDARIEYAFINQYAYTHKYDITRYTHEGYIIGHRIGTDADDLWFDVKRWFTDRFRVSLTYERERQGEGNVEKKHSVDGPRFWEFLSGVAQTTHSFSVGLSYVSFGRYSIEAEYTHSRIRNADHNPGINRKGHQLIVKAENRF